MALDASDISSVHDYLVERGATLYLEPRRKAHAILGQLGGRVYTLPVAWDVYKEILVHLPAGFPSDAPCIFLPNQVQGKIIPHVDHRGCVCTLPGGVTLNSTNAVGIVKAVLGRAEALLTRSYTEKELATEIRQEIYAYWNETGAETILLSPRDIEQGTWFALEPDPASPKTLLRLKVQPSGSLTKPCGILNLSIPSPQVLLDQRALAAEIAASAELPHLLSALRGFCSACKSHVPQELRLCFVLRVTIDGDQFFFAMELKSPLKGLLLRRPLPRLVEAVQSSLRSFRKLPVENVGTDRLIRRSAARDETTPLAEVRLALIGCGSLGGFTVDGLSRAGLSRFHFVDEKLLDVSNLGRHLLTSRYLGQPKAAALKAFLCDRFTELEIDATVGDITQPATLRRILDWKPTILLSTTGDNNADFALSKATQEGSIPLCAFAWVEPRLAAGHLVLQPAGSAVSFRDLHEVTADGVCLYRHRVIANPSAEDLQELGCQTNYTPYSGLDLIRFAADLARFGVTRFLNEKVTETTTWRWLPQEQPTWKENALSS